MTIPGSIRSLSGRPLAFTPSPSCTHLRAVTRSVRQSHRVYARPRSLARSLARPPARSSICACAPTAMCQQLLQPTHTSQYGATPRPTARLLRPSPLSCTLCPVPCTLHPAFCAHARPCALPEVHNPKTTTYSTVGHCRGALHCSLTCLLLLCLPLSWLTRRVCQALAFMRGVFEGVSDL